MSWASARCRSALLAAVPLVAPCDVASCRVSPAACIARAQWSLALLEVVFGWFAAGIPPESPVNNAAAVLGRLAGAAVVPVRWTWLWSVWRQVRPAPVA